MCQEPISGTLMQESRFSVPDTFFSDTFFFCGLARQGTNPLRPCSCHHEEIRFQRLSQDSGNPVVNSACRDSAEDPWQFGVRSRPARRRSGRAARGVCSASRGNQPA